MEQICACVFYCGIFYGEADFLAYSDIFQDIDVFWCDSLTGDIKAVAVAIIVVEDFVAVQSGCS